MNAPSVRCLIAILVLLTVSVSAKYCEAAALYLPEAMGDNGCYRYLYGISNDGTTVVGVESVYGAIGCDSPSLRLFVGSQSIDFDSYSGVPYAVSGDGSVVVGCSYRDNQGSGASRWTRQDGVVLLGTLGDGDRGSCSRDVSDNGEIIVGNSYLENGHMAFRWTEQMGMLPLGVLESCSQSRTAAISADGNVAVGFSGTDTTDEAFRWTFDGGMEGLGRLEGKLDSYAKDVSADGSIIVGWSGAGQHDGGYPISGIPSDEAFIWTEEEGMRGLGFLPGHDWSQATAISADGSTIVGVSGLISESERVFGSAVPRKAFIWDADHGMRSLDALLSEQYGLDLPDWRLGTPLGISGDGSVIIGSGFISVVTSGVFAGWPPLAGGPWIAVVPKIAAVPEPSTYIMICAGILVCFFFRFSTGG